MLFHKVITMILLNAIDVHVVWYVVGNGIILPIDSGHSFLVRCL